MNSNQIDIDVLKQYVERKRKDYRKAKYQCEDGMTDPELTFPEQKQRGKDLELYIQKEQVFLEFLDKLTEAGIEL